MQPRSAIAHAIEQAGADGFFVKGIDTQRLIDHLLVLHASRGAGERTRHRHRRPGRASCSPTIMRASRRRSSRMLSFECDVVGVVADGSEVAEAAAGFSRSWSCSTSICRTSAGSKSAARSRDNPRAKVIVITGMIDEAHAGGKLAGASDFFPKRATGDELVVAIKQAWTRDQVAG